MKTEEKKFEISDDIIENKTRTIRIQKKQRKREITTIEINESIIGDPIETMLERIREGEGEDSIAERDLVYNDNESSTVNPVTNIRSDRFELMLEEKIGEQEFKNKKHQKITEEIEKIIEDENIKITDNNDPKQE